MSMAPPPADAADAAAAAESAADGDAEALRALIERYDVRVPRYTSYPTAPHFGPAIDADRYRGWLADLAQATPLSLYLHIPFCDEMCWFCGCYTKIVQRYEPISAYLDALEAEIALVARALPGRFAARHLHWGGGSPTMLTPADWARLVGHLRDHFDVAADAELAVEIDPRDATPAYIAALAAAGVNRASIGVQDFDPEVQRAINRMQPFAVVERVVGWLRENGITRINLDLMYGLPHQTRARVLEMVDRALTLAPSRIALFGYAHVPWMKSHQKLIDAEALPDAAQRLTQAIAAGRRLEAAGFVAVGLDHFARPDDGLAQALAEDRLRRNFQGYTTDAAPVLLGLGASAIGALPAGYVQNLQPLKSYREEVAAGRLPVARGLALSDDDRLRRDVIEALMCRLEVDLAAVLRHHRRPAATFAAECAALAPFVADGLVQLAGERVTITPLGRPLARIVAATFDAYLQTGIARHSRAV